MRRSARFELLPVLALGCGFLALCGSAGASRARAQAASSRELVLYSVPEQEQFVNNADDRDRGEGHNPFGVHSDVAPPVVERQNGPFPGDESLFSFNVYKDVGLKVRVGAASFTCQYNFGKNAFCDASFQLKNGGTLIAAGAFNFAASRFTLLITGGDGRYENVTGYLEATPSERHAQRLVFHIN